MDLAIGPTLVMWVGLVIVLAAAWLMIRRPPSWERWAGLTWLAEA